MPWNPPDEYQRVVDANREFYSQNATRYDATETCVVSGRLQSMLERDLDEILQLFRGDSREPVHALDACGGSGNVAMKLLRRGVDVTLCDISPELIRIFTSNCERHGLPARAFCQEVGSFLAETDQRYSLIVFSSALHHIEDYTSVLQLATTRLKKGGLIYTVFDPLRWEFPAWQLIWTDYFFFKLLNEPDDLARALKKFLRRKVGRTRDSATPSGKAPMDNLNSLVEFHLRTGIDDLALVDNMAKIGLEVVWHRRYTEARHLPFRTLLAALGRQTNFRMLLRKIDEKVR